MFLCIVEGTVAQGLARGLSDVVIEDSVAPVFEVAAVVVRLATWIVRVTGNAGSQRSTDVEAARLELEDHKDVEAGSDPCSRSYTVVAGAVCVLAPNDLGNDVMVRVVELTEKLKLGNLSVHSELAAGRAAHNPALMDTIRLQ